MEPVRRKADTRATTDMARPTINRGVMESTNVTLSVGIRLAKAGYCEMNCWSA